MKLARWGEKDFKTVQFRRKKHIDLRFRVLLLCSSPIGLSFLRISFPIGSSLLTFVLAVYEISTPCSQLISFFFFYFVFSYWFSSQVLFPLLLLTFFVFSYWFIASNIFFFLYWFWAFVLFLAIILSYSVLICPPIRIEFELVLFFSYWFSASVFSS